MKQLNQSSKKRYLIVSMMTVVILGIFASFSFSKTKVDTSKVYRIGYGNDAPFHFDHSGEPAGLAVELVKEAADRVGMQLEWISNSGFDRKKMDFWVLMTIKPERKESTHFTDPYLQSRSCFLVLADSHFNETQDLANSRVSHVDYGVHRENLRKFIPHSHLLPVDSTREAVTMLLNGESEAAYLDQYAALRAILEGGLTTSVRVISSNFPPMVMGLASSFKEAPAADHIRRGMRSMVDDGKVTEIISRWAMFPRLTDSMVEELVVAQRRVTSLYIFSGLLVLFCFASVFLLTKLRFQNTIMKKLQKQLKEQADRYLAIVENSKDIVYMVDHKGDITFISQQASRYGIDPKKSESKNFLEFVYEEDRERVQREFFETFASGEVVLTEFRIMDGEGNPIWFEENGNLSVDEQGQFGGITGVLRDITHRKESENLIQHQRELLRATLENLAEGVIACGSDGTVILVNKTARDWMGKDLSIKSGEALNRMLNLFHLTSEEPIKPEATPMALALAGNPLRNLECIIKSENQPSRIIACNGSPIYSQTGDNLGAVVVMHDITERKRKTDELHTLVEHRTKALQEAKLEAERANSAKSVFLSRMSHELRTPLNSILGFGQLLERTELSDQQQHNLGHIRKAGRHLLDLINDILDISRVETGNIAIAKESVNLASTLRSAIDLIRPFAASHGIGITEPKIEGESTVIGDRKRLEQVFLNLLSNAVKYNKKQGSIRFLTQTLENNRIRIGFIDTGEGIPTEMQDRLFVPFDRLNVDQKGIEGTGLGLSLSRSLVEAMNGNLTGESEVGKGSTFWVELDQSKTTESEDEPESSTEHDLVLPPESISSKMLYIEDNEANSQLVEEIVTLRPHIKLMCTPKGSIGLEMAVDQQPGIIFLDLHLPDMKGKEVLTKLKEGKLTKDIPVIILTADATEKSKEDYLEAGATKYITKPFDITGFLAILDKFCPMKQAKNSSES